MEVAALLVPPILAEHHTARRRRSLLQLPCSAPLAKRLFQQVHFLTPKPIWPRQLPLFLPWVALPQSCHVGARR